jgi:hypothetical protein
LAPFLETYILKYNYVQSYILSDLKKSPKLAVCSRKYQRRFMNGGVIPTRIIVNNKKPIRAPPRGAGGPL